MQVSWWANEPVDTLRANGGRGKSAAEDEAMRHVPARWGLLLACCLLAVTSSAHAARRTALAGNLLIEDKDDLFLFPQLLTQYRNLIALDYGPSADTGNG